MLLTGLLVPLFTWTSVHAILAALGLAASIIGGLFWYLMGRIDDTEDEVDEVSDDITGVKARVDTLWRWAFGVEDDSTDKGIAHTIDEGFDAVSEDVNRLERKMDTYREDEKKEFRNLVNALHDDDSVDIERDDVFEDDD